MWNISVQTHACLFNHFKAARCAERSSDVVSRWHPWSTSIQMKYDIWRGILSQTNSIPITSCPDRSKPGVLHELKADLGNSETALREEWKKSSHIVGKRWRLCQKAEKEIWLRRLRGRLVRVRQKHGDICALIYSQQILWGPRAT